MKLFFTEDHLINLEMITSVDLKRGVVYMPDGNRIPLSNYDLRALKNVMTELHRQSCERD